MVLSIIVISVLSIMATIIGTLALVPVMNELGTDIGGHWEDASQQAIDARDRTFNALLVLPIFLIGSIAAWAYLNSAKRDFSVTD